MWSCIEGEFVFRGSYFGSGFLGFLGFLWFSGFLLIQFVVGFYCFGGRIRMLVMQTDCNSGDSKC